jgi:alpha/beta superfamily hydrolase
MYNKVVVKAAEALLEARHAVLRFNMRGTGRSEGETPDHEGARQDLAEVMEWLAAREEGRAGPIKLAGYSYGAYIALSAPVDSGGIVAIAFPASMPEFHLSRLPPVRLRFVHGTTDELVSAKQMEAFLQAHRREREVFWVEGANHTFDGRLGALREACRKAL